MDAVTRMDAVAVARVKQRAMVRRKIARIMAYGLTSLLSVLFMAPFVWMISMSLQSMVQLSSWPPQWIPDPFRWDNYPRAMTWPGRPFAIFFQNSIVYTVLFTVGVTISSSITGYAFARLQAKGRDALFVLVLSTMMLPSQVTLIPQYFLFKWLDWIDTLRPLIVPAWFGSAFNIFMFRQFFLTIPRELDEAAILDGCTYPGIFWRVIMPLSKPVLVTVVAFSAVYTWNDFFGPLIYLNSTKKMTVAVGMRVFAQMGAGMGGVNELGVVMAAATTTVVPMVIVFLAAQRYFVAGITMTGLKV